MAIRRIALVVNNAKAEAPGAANIVRAWAHKHSVPCREYDVREDGRGASWLTEEEEALGRGTRISLSRSAETAHYFEEFGWPRLSTHSCWA